MLGIETGQGPKETLPDERKGYSCHAGGVMLVAVVLLALALRLYRLSDQSLWHDDCFTFAFLQAADLQTGLRIMRALAPEHEVAPLYYVLQYFYSKWAGMNIETLRLLPLACAVSAVPLLYGFVRFLFGGRTAMVAALCLALSPQHIWYSQAIRPYEMIMPFAVISAWTFMLGYRKRSPVWWAVNLITNTLLIWTSLLMVTLLLTEGLFLLFFSLRRFRRVAIWSAVQLLLLVPTAVLVLGMPFVRDYVALLEMPPWRVLNFVLGGDVVCFHEDLMPSWKIHGASFARFPLLIPLWPWISLGLLELFAGAATWGMICVNRSLQTRRNAVDPPQSGCCQLENRSFLLLLLFVPGLTLALIGTRVVVFSSYAMYSQIALYALVGAALMAIPGALLRRGAVVALVLLYSYQLLVFLPEVTRTDWKGAAAYILNNASPGDEIIHVQHWLPDRELGFYMPADRRPRLVGTFQAACDDSARFLKSIEGTASGTGGGHAWIIVQTANLGWITADSFDCMNALRLALKERGLRPSFKEFPGQFELLVCKVEPDGSGVHGIGTPVWQIRPYPEIFLGARMLPVDYEAVLDLLGFQGCEQRQRSRLLAALRESVDHWPVDERFPWNSKLFSLWPVFDLAARGHGDLAEALAGYLVGQHQNYALLHMALGVALLKEEKTVSALGAFGTARRLDPNLGVVLAPFIDAAGRADEPGAVCREAEKLQRDGFLFGPAFTDLFCSDKSWVSVSAPTSPPFFENRVSKTATVLSSYTPGTERSERPAL